jgi:hypothetical protein
MRWENFIYWEVTLLERLYHWLGEGKVYEYRVVKSPHRTCTRSLASRRIIGLSNGEGEEGRGVKGRSMITGSAVMRGLVELSMERVR